MKRRFGRNAVYCKQCQYCFVYYQTGWKHQKHCSQYCRGLSRRTLKNKIFICAVCFSGFVPSYKKQKCCSAECAKVKEAVTKSKFVVGNRKDRRNAIERHAAKTDPKFKLNRNMRRAIHFSLKGNKNGHSWQTLVGYSLEQLKRRLKRQFQPGMTWDNYGEWHIDHKIPISAFNFTKPEHDDFKRCWALKNLQPLWSNKNQIKHAKLSKPFQPRLKM